MNQIDKQTQYIGTIHANARGFGFATTESGVAFFVTPVLMKSLVPGDTVTFTVEPGKQPDEYQVAAIISVVREPTIWLGELEHRNGRNMLVPDSPCFIGIELPSLRYIAPGDVVAVRVGPSSGKGTIIRGELIGVLGPRTRPGFDHDYVMARQDLKVFYDTKTLMAARDAGTDVNVSQMLAQGYVDMRHIPLVTIDGESTRDFDDAVYAEKHGEVFKVYVAIADVSAYVTPHSALDKEARERCTSVYLPGRTIPMLPEALSTGLCSLNPGKDRLALVCISNVDSNGQLFSWEFKRAIIQSHARLTYAQVYARMQEGVETAPLGSEIVESSFVVLNDVFKRLLQARRVRGVLEFNDVEPRLVTREDGQFDLMWDERNDAHRLVEEMMLLANQAAASELTLRKVPALYRHQQLPDVEDWVELQSWLYERGIEVAAEPSLKEMSLTLQQSKSRDDIAVIEARMRKVMQYAVYDTADTSHFSLGYAAYTHFTSPIRRYSDLLVHRILKGEHVSEKALKEAASLCSEKSRASRVAERFVWERIKKRILVRDIAMDDPLEAAIISSNRRGLGVVLKDWQCMAFVANDSLQRLGLTWNPDKESWVSATNVLEPGSMVHVQWSRLEEYKSRCELSANLVSTD